MAVRQLDTAICLMFNGGDMVSVHTLACTSATILRDLLRASGETAWRDHIVNCYPGEEKEVIRVLNQAQNFFKHADKDPIEELEFEEVTNDETIIIATLEYGELLRIGNMSNQKLTTPMSVFQVWYFAKSPEILLNNSDDRGKKMAYGSQKIFPDLKSYPRKEQLALGAEFLNKEFANRRGIK